MIDPQESPRDFEERGLKLARSLHDPNETQGAVMHRGRERDGLFISEDAIHAYEFTTDPRKAKAEKDAGKLREILEDLHRDPNHKYKAPTGWFVTRHEPTAEQRTAVQKYLNKVG